VKQVTVVVPGSLATRTGGSIYDRRIVQGLKARGWHVTVVELDPVSHPLAPPLDTALPQFAGIPDGSVVLIDGLAFGTMPELIEREAWRLRFVPIVHMPLSATPGLTRGDAAWLANLERRALKHARHIVITGHRVRTQVQALYGSSDSSLITRIRPGAVRITGEPGTRAERGSVCLLCVANLTPGKGHDILLRALAGLGDANWTLMCSGSDSRDPGTAGRLRSLAADLGVASRVAWRGESDDASLGAVYAAADLFVLATRGETYGMAVAEAISYGVPVISTRTGEIPAIVGDGGLLAEPGDVEGFSALLAEAVGDATLRTRLRDGARAAAERLPTWDEAADAMAAVLTRVAASG
jgi:glycosyltransferase involved in cell wall biosynthesis